MDRKGALHPKVGDADYISVKNRIAQYAYKKQHQDNKSCSSKVNKKRLIEHFGKTDNKWEKYVSARACSDISKTL